MSTFKNVSGEDREVQIDGNRIFVASGDEFKVADEFDYQLVDQPHFAASKSRPSAPAESTPEPSSTVEGEK